MPKGPCSPLSVPICGILTRVETQHLSTLYAFAGQAGPQRAALISKPDILPARHSFIIDEVKNRGLRIGQVLSVLHTEVDSIRATWHLLRLYRLGVQITRLSRQTYISAKEVSCPLQLELSYVS